MVIGRDCPMCGDYHRIEIKGKETAKKIRSYFNGEILLQQVPLCASTREFIKTGFCKQCQKKLFTPMEDDYE